MRKSLKSIVSPSEGRVLVVATSPATKGGISYVINAHKKGSVWLKYRVKWIPTHIDKGYLVKLFFFIKSFILYLFYAPSFQIIHIHLSEPASIIRKSPFFLVAYLLRKKIIIHFHSFSADTTIRGKVAWLYKYMFCRADKVLVLSDVWLTMVKRNFPEVQNIEVLYNPCLQSFSTSSLSKKKQILYAGVLNARKGYVDLINAFSLIASDFKDWQLVMAGSGEMLKAKQLCHELNIEKQVSFPGWIDGEEKTTLFEESSIFCLPSYAEGFPMAVLDAWALNLPVVTTLVGGLPDVVVDEENALCFEPGNREKLAMHLRRLMNNSELRENIARESHQLATSIFSPQRINQRLDDIYQSLLK